MGALFTPWPWVARISLNGRVNFIQGAPCEGAAYGDAVVLSVAKPSSARGRANAHLIAAAPDLYEAAAMQEAAEVANANCDECGGEGDWTHCSLCSVLFGDAIDRRDSALAKARGAA